MLDMLRQFAGQLSHNEKVAAPEYCYIVNLDAEWRMTDNRILFCEAVTELREGFDDIWFERTPAIDVVSVMHEGAHALLSFAAEITTRAGQ